MAGSIALATTTIAFSHNLEPFKCNDGKWGFKDGTNAIRIPCKYDTVTSFNQGLAKVNIGKRNYMEGNKMIFATGMWGLINTNGEYVVEPIRYLYIDDFEEGLARVKDYNYKYGFIDTNGNEVIKPIYDFVYRFGWGDDHRGRSKINNPGLARVNIGGFELSNNRGIRGGKWGLINKNGEVVVEPKYNYMFNFYDGLATVNIGGRIPLAFLLDGEWGLIDMSGKELFPLIKCTLFEYSRISGLVRVIGVYAENGKSGFIDKSGRKIGDIKYDYVNSFNEGLAAVNIGKKYNEEDDTEETGKWGFIDTTGLLIIDFAYDDVLSLGFSSGFAAVGIINENGEMKYGFIDKSGRKIGDIKYDWVGNFYGGLASVNIGGKYNKEGEFTGGKWGFIDTTGTVKIDIKYDEVESLYYDDRLARVKLNGEWFCIDRRGNRVACE